MKDDTIQVQYAVRLLEGGWGHAAQFLEAGGDGGGWNYRPLEGATLFATGERAAQEIGNYVRRHPSLIADGDVLKVVRVEVQEVRAEKRRLVA